MALSKSRWAIVLALIPVVVYFLLFHKDPFPANHEAIGLGELHILHDAIGVVLLAVAGYVWYTGRKAAVMTPQAS